MAPLHVLPLLLLSFLSSIVSVSAHFKLEYPPARGDSFLPPASQWVYPCMLFDPSESLNSFVLTAHWPSSQLGANINTTTNRTLYSLDSFNVGLDLHHNWTYVFVNLGSPPHSLSSSAFFPSPPTVPRSPSPSPCPSHNIPFLTNSNWPPRLIGLGTNGSSDFNISLTPSPLNVTGKGNLCLQDFDLPTNLRLENGLDATIQVVTVGASGSALYNVSQSIRYNQHLILCCCSKKQWTISMRSAKRNRIEWNKT